LRDDRRGPGDPRARKALRDAFATALAVPVIGLIIVESVARRLGPTRPALLSLGLVAGTVAMSAFSTVPTGARPPTSPVPIAESEFIAIPFPSPTIPATEPIVRSLARSPSASPSESPNASPNESPSATPSASPEATPVPQPPAVVRFRPRDGWADVSRFAAVSVRFTKPMGHASTEAAFHVVAGDTPVNGTFRWAEGDTVLVLTPSAALPYGAAVALSVDIEARASDGLALAETRSAAFTVEPRPAPVARPAPTAPPKPPSSAWRWPLLGPITQRFGESLTRYGVHQGLDINGETGDPVRAARGGRVVVAGSFDQCGGIQVHIDHGDGVVSWYRHLSRVDVAKGTLVEAGTVIGRVGNTGCSLGSHLHFGIRKGSTFVDPLGYLPPR